ncbi:TerB N-terminal domain-containing protein [bacterium]|nr:TerB N-terminal domain-containing protein [bacterium]
MFVAILFLAFIFFIWILLHADKQKREQQHRNAAMTSTPTITFTYGIGRSRQVDSGAKLEWAGEGSRIDIGGYSLLDPLTYFSKTRPNIDEASCIDLSLPVGKSIREAVGSLGYWPSYERLTSDQRATYLQWLSKNRKEIVYDVGYAFIYYYGLERRFLVDNQDCAPVLNEVLRMREDYLGSGSFQHYSTSFLTYAALRLRNQDLNIEYMDMIATIARDNLSEDLLAVVLGWHHILRCPMPAALAMRVAQWDSRAVHSVVLERVPDQFHELFAEKYSKRYDGGLVLDAGKRQKVISYNPASASLRGISIPVQTIPDVLVLTSQIKPLVQLWNECVEELRPLNRIAASGGNLSSREAYEALPDDLRRKTDHPDAGKWTEVLKPHIGDDGIALIEISKLAPLLEIAARDKLTMKQSRDLADTAQHVGYVIEPDGRILSTAYHWDSLVSLFHDEEILSKPIDPRFKAASLVLQLGLWIAAADGTADEQELRVLTSFISGIFDLAPHEGRRLEMHKKVLLVRPSEPGSQGKRIQQVLNDDQREKLGELLVAIAAATSGVDESEWRTLRKAYRSLGIPVERLDALIESLIPDQDELVTVRPPTPGLPGEPIPVRRHAQAVPIVHLNADRLRAILANTREVTAVLAGVFAEEETVESVSIHTMTAPIAMSIEYPGLAPRYHSLLKEILEKDNWTSSDFAGVIAKHGLMRVDVVERLNLWSDEVLGDFLIIEDHEMVHIQTTLLDATS